MTQTERRLYLINTLLGESPRYRGVSVPAQAQGQKDLLRSLMNVRMPGPLTDEYISVEAAYLTEETRRKGITDIADLTPVQGQLYLWQGDITTLKCDAIVNAANSQMLGCFRPLHNCEDNCVHSAAGLRLRNYCNDMMERQGYEEPTGQAKITPAFNLPSRFVLHTVGPIVDGELRERHCALLASCYASCLKLAEENGCAHIAFCCISTGVFGFPQKEAAGIAVQTVKDWLAKTGSKMKVIFNVFRDDDLAIYRGILG